MERVALDATFLIDLQNERRARGHATAHALRTKGRLIGTNDLWIACTAKAANVPLVTRNGAHFKRVSGLVVVEYSP